MTTDDSYAARSLRELEAGRLPLRAQDRLAELTGDEAFTSQLSASGHLALRQVGLVPVGQVVGMSVVQPAARSGGTCGVGRAGGSPVAPARSAFRTAGTWRDALLGGARLAAARLMQEAAALGADGVVDVRFDNRHLPGTQLVEEFVLTGTAVRSRGATRRAQPFSSALSAVDAAALLRRGWAPVRLLYGLEIGLRHDDATTVRLRQSWSNGEVDVYSDLVTRSRAAARRSLETLARESRCDGVILSSLDHRVYVRRCASVQGSNDHLVRAHALGTSIRRVPKPSHRPTPGALPVLALRP